MLQWTPLQPDREGIKEREDAEKGRVGGGERLFEGWLLLFEEIR